MGQSRKVLLQPESFFYPLPLKEGEGRGDGNMKELTRKLRKEQTDTEMKLWNVLRNRELSGFKFRRQHEIGPYVVDFCCSEKKFIIEVDGGHHMEQISKDQQRTDYLNQLGYQVLRFWDHEVLEELDSVLESIRIHLMNDPHPNPVRMARGGSNRRPIAAQRSRPLPKRERESFNFFSLFPLPSGERIKVRG